ncbi:MAG: hypothetical protein C0617_07285 [Desulfuromonas sp.]|uniref:hypothetical protein n=1 Tax=Desulfuromonas sp. TaxID=892 RepID=UPI000CBEAFFE|nr:hypothetical protein [Desulfuromonas sp.]PLX84635.1 MAG: hypothetical protein C0617_07285 [Desulfuromonas sp.]
MKYIMYIVSITLLLTLGIWGYDFLSTPSAPPDGALVINDRVISPPELEMKKKYSSYHQGSQEEFIEGVVTRELLIQEAQRAGIDREESFRLAIQDFFEQSLIKVLMDRQYRDMEVSVGPEELEAYRDNIGKFFHLTVLNYPSEKEAIAQRGERPEAVQEFFGDLPWPLRDRLLHLQQGQTSEPFSLGEEFVRLRLDKVERTEGQQVEPDGEMLRTTLLEEKKRKAMDSWLNELRQKAAITLPEAIKDLGTD